MPNDAQGQSIIEAYQRALAERGFRFAQYFEGPGMVLLVKRDGEKCEVMIFGLPYLPPEQRTNLLLMFHLRHPSAEQCQTA